MKKKIEIYQSEDGQAQIDVWFQDDTVWLDRHQLAELFARDVKTIGKHLSNVFRERELDKEVVVANFATTTQHGAMTGKTQTKHVENYNLDVIISIGYRVKSQRGTQFRQWATKHLKDYLVQGYAINQKRLEQRQQEVRFLKSGIQILSRAIESKAGEDGFEWLQQYALGLTLLDDYDYERLDTKGQTLRQANFPAREDYQKLIDEMKTEFNTDVFGVEKDQSFDSAIGQITKGFGKEDFYPSLEEKAAMLLYLIIKNHPFVDGNKRIAAACFLYFLKENSLLHRSNGESIISNEALASLTLYVAVSNPEEIETVKRLIVSVLNRNQ